jgi:hypothetical protein
VALINCYCTLSDVKDALAINDINDDTAIEASILAASRMIDDYTGRFFYKDGTTQAPVTRYFTPLDWWTCATDDFISISQIATDDNFDQVYSTVWSTSDYMVEPVNNPRRGWPYTRVLAIGSYIFPAQLPQTLRISGVWGWSSIPYEIQMATKLQASRLFVRKQSPFGVAGSVDIGTVRLSSRLDPDVEALVRPFKKMNGLAY